MQSMTSCQEKPFVHFMQHTGSQVDWLRLKGGHCCAGLYTVGAPLSNDTEHLNFWHPLRMDDLRMNSRGYATHTGIAAQAYIL